MRLFFILIVVVLIQISLLLYIYNLCLKKKDILNINLNKYYHKLNQNLKINTEIFKNTSTTYQANYMLDNNERELIKNIEIECGKGKQMDMERLLKFTILKPWQFEKLKKTKISMKFLNKKDYYMITFNYRYFREFYGMYVRLPTCSIQQFDKEMDQIENVKMIGPKIVFLRADGYRLVIDKHGFYYLECFVEGRLKFNTVFTVLPRDMRVLIDDNKYAAEILMEFKNSFRDSSINPLVNDVNYEKCGNFSEQIDNINKMNVLIIGLESVSSYDVKSGLPETYSFLQSLKDIVFYENYQNIAKNTFANVGSALLTGLLTNGSSKLFVKSDIKKFKIFDQNFHDLFPFIWKEYEKAGYLTMYNEDNFKTNMFVNKKKGFRLKTASFYTLPLFVYYNKLKFDENMCHYNQLLQEKELDDLKMFMDKMNTFPNSDLPYFSFNYFKLYHNRFDLPSSYDHKLKETLNYFMQNGYFKNTLFILMLNNKDELKKSLKTTQAPFFSMLLPEQILNTTFANNAIENKLKLFTPFDVYKTLKQFYYFNRFGINSEVKSNKCREYFQNSDFQIRHRRGISLFENISYTRTCLEALVPSFLCNSSLG